VFKNYVKIAVRNLIRNKTNSIISILGLAVGLAVCTLLLLYVQDELSYDRFHQKGNRIYRLCHPDHPYQAPQTARLLADKCPEIEDFARILVSDGDIFQYKEKKFKESLFAFADASLFRMFTFDFKKGNPETALREPYSMVISERIAQKYFGNENPIGKTIVLNNEHNYTITGVMENMPYNSHIRYDCIATLTDAEKIFGANMMANWGWQNFVTYFLLHPDFNKSDFETKCGTVIAEHQTLKPNQKPPVSTLQALKDIHLHSAHFRNDIQPQSDINVVLIFSGIGVLILLIACLNYINLFTAQAINRANEIGIKKVVGATRKQLAAQFAGESFIILLLAFLFSLCMIEFFLPTFNTLAGKHLSFISLLQVKTVLSILGIFLLTGIIASSYPAFVLSSLQPTGILKTEKNESRAGIHFRKILVGVQFTIVIVFIISAVFMLRQLDYLQNKKLGYEKELVLVSEFKEIDDIYKFKSLKDALLQQNDVLSVASASRVPSDRLNNRTGIMLDGQTEWINMPIVHVSYDYFETLGITAAQGRLFSKQMQTDINDALILNRAAVNKLGLPEESVGMSMKIGWPDSKRKVIGIVDDFHFESLYETIKPVIFVVHYPECSQLMVKIKSTQTKKTVENLRSICQKFYPELLFEFHFLDEQLEAVYQADVRTFKLIGCFTGLAIFIACMGLFGLASFMMKRRTKELGIRKVLGASLSQILISLTQDFIKWILLANLIAWPIAWYAMNKWLQNFAYRIEISLWMFVLSGGLAMGIALLTIGWQAVKAATANPVESLRYE
jgi:putative ABC transport system permease protein